MKEDTLFWDVDTQFDFMRPEGKLYVPGAETIIDKVSEVRKFALDNGYSIIADIDWHSADNDEISETPDFERTFPPHCMAGESGSERVGFLGELPIEYVEITKTEHDTLRRLISKKQFHVVIKKDALDVFSNPNTSELVKHIGLKNVIIFGVALDFCVDCVVRGLSSLGDIRLCVLNDAVKGLGTRPESEIFDEYAQMGVEIAEFNTVREKLLCGC
ncbi:MAG: cysteine hydrolase family protein [Planctomycetota bacterium]|jgi:nicotinamidase/pyrazinamidase